MMAMEPDRTPSLRKKIDQLGRELEQLSRAIKEEVSAHERWDAAMDVPDGGTHEKADQEN